MMDIDRYPDLSNRRQKAANLETCVELVRKTWPNAYAEGSCGRERTFFSETEIGRRVVAHCWSPWKMYPAYWIRIASSLQTTLEGF